MRVAILHNRVTGGASLDEADVLAQVEAVQGALRDLGHEVRAEGVDLDLERLKRSLLDDRPDVVFNLVEALEGTGRLVAVVPGLLDALGIPYTGASTEAILLTTNKVLAKERLVERGFRTPAWRMAPRYARAAQGDLQAPGRWIVKSVWEHASIGIDDGAIAHTGAPAEIARLLAERAPRLGGSCFAERFVDGRELNLSLLSAPGMAEPDVLPPAEITFDGFPEGKAKIVGYSAKWEEGSFEYQNTQRRFDFPDGDRPLLDELTRLSREVWSAFDLSGYARVDFRVDPAVTPWILEVNANPCIAPDAGFTAAVERAGLTYEAAVDRILQAALHSTQAGLRTEVRPSDAAAVRDIVASTGFFNSAEVEIAVELVMDRADKGPASGYQFVFADDDDGRPLGYTCYGATPGTRSSWDLYWIAVHAGARGGGLGKRLIDATERDIARRGGTRIYVETSGRPQYAPTRGFYQATGYRQVAVLDDFYAPGDGKVIYLKTL